MSIMPDPLRVINIHVNDYNRAGAFLSKSVSESFPDTASSTRNNGNFVFNLHACRVTTQTARALPDKEL